MHINWNAPSPRRGLAGEWDKFVGPGQTRAEFWLILLPSIIFGAGVPFYAISARLGWSTIQLIIAGVVAFDLLGGVITNATATAKRWYHRPGEGWVQHLLFISVHALHLLLIVGLFRHWEWLYFIIFYVYLILSSLIITRIRLYLQRPVAMLLLVIGILLNVYAFPPSPGLEWFIPVFFLKLLVSHLIVEAPFSSDRTKRMD